MALRIVLLSVLLAVPSLAQIGSGLANTNTSSSTACANLHIIVVRASTEPPSQGIIGTLATLITTANPGSSVEWIQYPALLAPYNSSEYNGTEATTARLTNYVDTCAQANVVLLGYSQGAQVIGDVMCGGGNAVGLGPPTPPVDAKYADKVIAMIQMGDPRFMTNTSFDVGTATMGGIFPRPANISCQKYASIIQSYCDMGDPFCASGGDLAVHLNYTNKYNNVAFSFVQGKIQAAATKNSSSNSSGSGSSSSPSKSSGGNSSTSGATALLRTQQSQPYYISILLAITLGALFTLGL